MNDKPKLRHVKLAWQGFKHQPGEWVPLVSRIAAGQRDSGICKSLGRVGIEPTTKRLRVTRLIRRLLFWKVFG